MNTANHENLETLAEGLALAFYLLMFVALVMALNGSAGSGFLLLVVGSCAQVGRAALIEFVDTERGRGERPQSRSRPAPAVQRAPRPQRVAPNAANAPAPERARVRLRA